VPRTRRLSCQAAVELVTDHLEAVLTPVVQALLEDHLRSCPTCAEYVRQVRVMVRALRRLAPATPPDGPARTELLVRYRRWIAA